ncbi:MAG: right-handed parallel beta-helix repeat-containing protein [Bacteroidetes bacterium]|nr:right-handed parallel beta-helix repeat-containing protein [Bacteroidota bacterium]
MRRFGRALCTLFLLLLAVNSRSLSSRYYVATTGSDSNPGTIDQPFLTISKGLSLSSAAFAPGDTLLLRGGTYTATATISIPTSKNGTSGQRYYLLAYPGERAHLDFSSMAFSSSNRGIHLRASYWHIRGLDIQGAGDNGMLINGSHNVVENCTFFENQDTGLQLGGGASDNQIINCDSYANADPTQGNADGFAPKLDVGTGNAFSGCRAWQNSDDGWDGYLRGANDVTTTLESCWCFSNGYLKDGSPSSGNGNGYKTGGSDTKDLKHNVILTRCLAFDNRVKGFDQNNNRGSITIYHGSAYRNGTNYGLGDTLAFSSGKVLTLANCVALGDAGAIHGAAVQLTNSWMPPFMPPSAADFVSIDTAGMRGPRKPDGSLPDLLFLRLDESSGLANAGTYIGLPYNGSAPDLGAFERTELTALRAADTDVPAGLLLLQNYPNPFNASTVFQFSIATRSDVVLEVFDYLGRNIRTLERGSYPPGVHTSAWDGRDDRGRPVSSGVYFVRLEADRASRGIRVVLAK